MPSASVTMRLGAYCIYNHRIIMNNCDEIPAHLTGLNPQQLDAIRCHEKIVFVNAGPGTGKTTLLVSKLIDHLITSHTPQIIVALSYTNTAARQIGERFYRQLGQSFIPFDFFNGTIHSFCFRMMKSYYESIGKPFDYTILDDEELAELSREVQEQSGDLSQYKRQLKLISVEDILNLYLEMLEKDMLYRDYMKEQATFMAIDEAQDLSAANYEILDRMLDLIPDLKLFLVGDPRQNIFEFNGGSYRNLDSFLSKHRHQVRNLTITYRCGQKIADYVNTFQFTDCENHPLQSQSKEEGILTVRQASDEQSEAREVIDSIKQMGRLEDCAVLSNNLKYLETLIRELKHEQIPYKVFGERKLVKRHIRFLNHILRILDNDNPYSISKIAQYAGLDIMQDGKKRKSLFFTTELGQLILSVRDDCATLGFTDLMNCVLERILRDPEDDEAISQDYDALLLLSMQYQTISDYLMAFASDKETFAAFYRKDYEDCEIPSDGEYLTLSTIHSAKGLEWDTVYVMGLCEGNFPNPYFCKDMPDSGKEEFFNNEWKKMYVAATRAKRSLILTYSSTIKRKGYSFKKQESRFISNI